MDGSRVADSKNNDGLGRIRTGDLRHVKGSFDSLFSRPESVEPTL